jgi:hypothetical protein
MTLVTLIPDFTNYLLQNNYLAKSYIIVLLILWTCINKYLGITFVLILVYSSNLMNNNIENFETNRSKNKDKEKQKNKDSKIHVVPSKIYRPVSSDDSSSKTKSAALEGFDLQSAEDTIKRGKQTTSIPVDQLVSQSTNDIVSPYESGTFSESFTNL